MKFEFSAETKRFGLDASTSLARIGINRNGIMEIRNTLINFIRRKNCFFLQITLSYDLS